MEVFFFFQKKKQIKPKPPQNLHAPLSQLQFILDHKVGAYKHCTGMHILCAMLVMSLWPFFFASVGTMPTVLLCMWIVSSVRLFAVHIALISEEVSLAPLHVKL